MVNIINEKDEVFMREAISLAQGFGNITLPNPRVGACLVKDGSIISRGVHKSYGSQHAEVDCIKNASQTQGCELYVTLEPCNHFGKTPPCTNAIINAGIKRVVVSTRDNNPNVAGGGVEALISAGINVTTGVLENEGQELNKDYFFAHQHKRPYVHLKYAMTLDGKIADNQGEARWISGKEARSITHSIRANVAGVLIGKNTAIRDNPALTVRDTTNINFRYKQPTRILLDSCLSIPVDTNLTKDCNLYPTIIAATVADERKRNDLIKRGVVISILPDASSKQIILKPLLESLYSKGIYSILVEGGSQVNASFFNERIGEEIHVFIAPMLLGGENIYPPFSGVPTRTISSSIRIDKPIWAFAGNDGYLHGIPKWQ